MHIFASLPASKMYPLLLCSFSLLFSLSTLSFSPASASARLRGFNLDLIHHDSLLSPFDDLTTSTSTSFELKIIAAEFSYLVNLDVTTKGHDSISTYANLDTGSDLIWLNGEGCKGPACSCGEINKCIQKPTTIETRVCDECDKLPRTVRHQCSKIKEENTCWYKLEYKDKFTSEGRLTEGIFSFTTPGVHGKHIWFGVSDHSKGTLNPKSAGIVGLGRDKLSLINQLNARSINFPFKFSYCLPHPNSKSISKLLLGSGVTISDNFTPLLTKQEEKACDKRYCVRLASILLNEDMNKKINVEHDNIIMFIDSGSTHTILNKTLFPKFIEKVEEITGEKSIVLDNYYRHCFKQVSGKNLKKVSFEFGKGVTLNLKEEVNFFHEKKHDNVDYLCLTVVEGEEKHNILGNRAQIGYKVAMGYDKENKEWKVSFDEENCGSEQNVEESLDFQE